MVLDMRGCVDCVSLPTSGKANRAIAAIAHIAPTQPRLWISFCRMGANTNWPKEPPALINPDAAPRASAGMRWAAAPSSTEKLLAPEPMAQNRPSETARPKPVPM
jgi:hypothetical protein